MQKGSDWSGKYVFHLNSVEKLPRERTAKTLLFCELQGLFVNSDVIFAPLESDSVD